MSTPADKRKAPDTFGTSQLVKRTKPDGVASSAVAVVNNSAQNGALIQAVWTLGACGKTKLKLKVVQVPRTSGLKAPIMELTGHAVSYPTLNCRVEMLILWSGRERFSRCDSIRQDRTLRRRVLIAQFVRHLRCQNGGGLLMGDSAVENI